jgi:NarL family two-component system response regulator LiaR
MEAIRVFVVDDHPMIRHGVAAMLGTDTGLSWVGEAGSGEEALRAAAAAEPHVVVMDTSLPDMDGLAALTALRPLLPRARFIMLGESFEPADARRTLAAGAAGYLRKDASTQELVQAIVQVHKGELATPAQRGAAAQRRLPSAGTMPGTDLTPRERELLQAMARGLSNQDISKEMGIAMPTVKFHVTNILNKLSADNRTEAVLVALRCQLVDLQ